ncbi:hypothetical protein PanWU01x14_369560, partial [Parasponia andersonii]
MAISRSSPPSRSASLVFSSIFLLKSGHDFCLLRHFGLPLLFRFAQQSNVFSTPVL